MFNRFSKAAALLAVALLSACSAEQVTSSSELRAVAPDAPLFSFSATNPQVVISQVYGGGGNNGSTLRNDFIELYNRGDTPVDVSGWSVQYASSTGSNWSRTNLTGSIPAGGFYLVQQARGTGGTVDLPTPDAIGTIAMAAGAGKVVLVSNQSTITAGVPCPSGEGIVDRVGFGTNSCAGITDWGAGTATLTAATAALRNDNGCAYTGVAGTDFTTGAPSPRTTASPTRVCANTGGPVAGPVAVVTLAPSTATIAVTGTQQLIATARDAAGLTVSAATFTWATADETIATVSAAGLVTGVAPGVVTITATSGGTVVGSATITVAPPATLPAVRFSEIHYDNFDVDFGEAIEIEGPAGTDLTGWQVLLYNGSNGLVYDTRMLTGVIPATCGASGVVVLEYTTGLLQNGPDGMALVNAAGDVVEFLSYEGVFVAQNGPAANTTPRNIGVQQNSAAVNTSLQRSLSDTWSSARDSFGTCNGRGARLPRTTLSFGFRTPFDEPLPVGFEDLLRVTERLDGVPVAFGVPAVSETPDIAVVLPDNTIRGVAPGTARFRATASTGLSLAFELPIRVATPGSAVYANHTDFGVPVDNSPDDDFVFTRDQLTYSYSKVRNTPNWVAYNLESTHIGGAERCECFTFDPALPADFTRYTSFEYLDSDYSRGHLAKSEDRTAGSLDNARSFYFSNIVPQTNANNSGPWLQLENYLTNLARAQSKEVFIVTGVAGNIGTLKDRGVVTIPGSLWKVAIVLPKDRGLADVNAGLVPDEVIAVIMPNTTTMPSGDWRFYRTTVDAVEMLSGYNLLDKLNDQIEIALESNTKPPVAAINGPFEILAGESVALSAAGSTDPDAGDVLSYFWQFGDGSNGSGLDVSHRYLNPGSYTVTLTVRDQRELLDQATTTVLVLSDAAAVERAATRVADLANAGRLNRGLANSLEAKLRAAAASVERGNEQAAVGQLGALVNELNALVQSRRLTEADAAPVIALLDRVIVSLQR